MDANHDVRSYNRAAWDNQVRSGNDPRWIRDAVQGLDIGHAYTVALCNPKKRFTALNAVNDVRCNRGRTISFSLSG